MFSHPDHLMLLAKARERDYHRLAARQQFKTSDELGWLSSDEETLLRLAIAEANPEPGIVATIGHTLRASASHILTLLGARTRRHAVAEAVTGDGA